jgi:hypothetical protein
MPLLTKTSFTWNYLAIMMEIQDSGKIWCKGSASPIHAVRTGTKIFATGKKEDQTIECWVDGDLLCIDLHGPGIRLARKFPLDLDPTLAGTLFNGFTRTKHADVSIVSSEQEGVEEAIVTGESYSSGEYGNMNSKEFWNKVWSLAGC